MTSSTIASSNAEVNVDNGSYTNPVTVISTATINSNGYGIASDHRWTIVNQGTIHGGNNAFDGVVLHAGGVLSNASGGTITGGDGVFVNNTGYGAYGVPVDPTGTVVNAGLIDGTTSFLAEAGVFLKYGGNVFNASTGTIIGGGDGVKLSGSGTVENAGTITGGIHDAVYFNYATYGNNTLIIDPGAVFNGNVYAFGGGNSIELKAGAGAHLLNGLGGKYTGFQTVTIESGATWDIVGTYGGLNGETIDGLTGSDSLDITDLAFVSGTTSAVLTGGVLAVTDGASTVDITLGTADSQKFYVHNDGAGGVLIDDLKEQLTGSYSSGIVLNHGSYFSSVSVTATGTVNGPGDGIYAATAWTVGNRGSIDGTSGGGVDLHAGGIVSNASGGTITGGTDGVYASTTAGTVTNAGSIYGETYGVSLHAGGAVSNASTGTIAGGQGGVYVANAAGTVENAGTIASGGNYAVRFFQGGDRLIVDPGAVFDGKVKAAGTGNTIELKTGASVGVLNGLGSSANYRGFQTVTIDSGAAWDVAGTKAGIAGSTIQDFNSHDRLDLTNLTFNAGDTAIVNGSDQLVITDGGGNVTIQMDGSVSGHLFTLTNDGSGHTFAEESNYTPCYCRGTRILTERGHVAVEHLKIGDRLMTLIGEDLPIKWIGRRGYRDWLAVGNLEVQPVCFRAGSIADGVPVRDLYVSPEHAMYLDGVLVPAQHLVNGVSIVKVEGMEEIEYFHLEFDRHVVIFAEGAAAESFVDDDSRMLFHNAEEYRRLYPDEARGRFTEFCAPRVEDGAVLDTIHRTLAARAIQALPDGTVAAIQHGYLDRATRTLVEGWAFAGTGEKPVKLAILVNGAVVGQTVADRYRAGLGFGDEHCSFRFALPRGLSSDVSHRIEVRRESDWSPLIGGCVTLAP